MPLPWAKIAVGAGSSLLGGLFGSSAAKKRQEEALRRRLANKDQMMWSLLSKRQVGAPQAEIMPQSQTSGFLQGAGDLTSNVFDIWKRFDKDKEDADYENSKE